MAKVAVMAGLALAAVSTGCRKPLPQPSDLSMPLVTVGDTTLTLADVNARIPMGISPEDSTALFAEIVESWMQDALLREMAADNAVDMDRIDRMTADYRNRLIINEYLRQMQRGRVSSPDEAEVRGHYELVKDDMRTDHPLVKGIYIKVPADADRLADLRRWMRSASKSSVDNIEKYGLAGAMEYECFMDRWVDWHDIAAQIPYRFGDGAGWLESHRDFETSDRTAIYLLHITEILPAGSVMPYDFAAPLIREAMLQSRRTRYGRDLMTSLAEKARSEGRLSTPGYDLRTHKTIINTKETIK